MKGHAITLAMVFLLLGPAGADVKTEMNLLTGNIHTRVVWLHGGTRFRGNSTIQGFDSQTGAIHDISTATNYRRVVLCSGGNKVVATSDDWKVYLIDWKGGTLKYLVSGYCNEVWKEPTTGKEWAIVRTGGESTSGDLYRYQLDNPQNKFLLWNKTNVGISWGCWYEVTPDGKMGAGFFPWSSAYVVDNGALQANGPSAKVSGGCWSSVEAANNKYWFHLGGKHDELHTFKYKTKIAAMALNMRRPSGYASFEAYHPRFASKGARFMTASAGYKSGETFGGNQNCPGAEIYIGKFKSSYTGFEGWVRVTHNSVGDYNGDAWVGVEGVTPPEPALDLSPAGLQFNAAKGGNNPGTQKVTATGTNGLNIGDIKVTGNAAWLTVTVSGTGDTRTLTNRVTVSGLGAGTQTTTVTVNAGGKTQTYTVRLTVSDPSSVHIKVNAGSNTVSGWETDDKYVSGGDDFSVSKSITTSGIASAAPMSLYQSCRHHEPTFTFGSLPNGAYTVKLHFAEPFYTTLTDAARRQMTVKIEGQAVLTNFSPGQAAGACQKAYIFEKEVAVSDGNGMKMEFLMPSGSGDAFVMGLEVISGSNTLIDPLKEPQVPDYTCHIYPNPFNCMTNIFVGPGQHQAVIYDMQGTVIKQLAGSNTLTWDGTTFTGKEAKPGIYWYQLNATGITGKIIKVNREE